VSRRRRLGSLYARIGRTFYSKAGSLLLLAVVVFLPLGLLDALAAEVSVDALNFGNGLKVAAAAGATLGLAVTGLLGEVFYSGAVAVSLTNPEHEHAPPIREVARRLDYRRLIIVDVLYVAVVAVGMVLVFIPGLLVFVWFGLSGPVVEIEKRTVRGAFTRSFHLVRHNFWTVLLVLGPIEIIGDSGGHALVGLVHNLLGHSLIATWLAESASNIVLTPILAVAAVQLTLDLIAQKDGAGDVPGSPAPLATPRR
jgi:hypothetical protein